MFSLSIMFNPWTYYFITKENSFEILNDTSYRNISTFNPVSWCGKKHTYYDRGNQSWRLAVIMAEDLQWDYKIAQKELAKRARTD